MRPRWCTMTTPPVGISIARHATDAVKSWPPRVFTERNGGGVTRVMIFPVASTVSSSTAAKRDVRAPGRVDHEAPRLVAVLQGHREGQRSLREIDHVDLIPIRIGGHGRV